MTDYVYPGTSPTYGVALNNGDTMTVLPHGYAASVTVNQGATQFVMGGDTLGVTVNAGGMEQVTSGNVSSVTVNTGGVVRLDGGRIDSPYVNGGTLYVGPAGTVAYTNDAHGGVEYLSGSTIDSRAYDGGTIILDQPGYQGDRLIDPTLTPNYIGSLTVGGGGTLEIKNGVTSLVNLNGGNIIVDPVHYDSSVSTTYDSHTGNLLIQGSTGSYSLKVFDQPGHGTDDFVLSASSSGAVNVTIKAVPLCFLPGVRLTTPDGDIAVEDIKPGCMLMTSSGIARRVVWVGGGMADPSAAPSVTVREAAFGPDVPSADLGVTAGHSFLFHNVFIPIGELVNGTSIVINDDPHPYRYFHVELEIHDVVLANNAPAESYRDDGNRQSFEWQSGTMPSPSPAYAAIVAKGRLVDLVWKSLADRAGISRLVETDHPDLHLLVNEVRVDPVSANNNVYVFDLKPGSDDIRLVSRHAVPAQNGSCRDHRRLGVALRRCWLELEETRIELNYRSLALRSGFHEAEDDARVRWTDGAALLPFSSVMADGPVRLGIELGCRAAYA